MSLGIFDFFQLIWSCDLIIICSRRFLLKWGFLFSQEYVYVKIETKLFLKAPWVLIASILLKISNLNWSLSYYLKLRYMNFFSSKFSNFVLRIVFIMVITQTNFKKFVVINENFEFVISKSMHEPLSPLKHVFCFIIL